MISPSGLAAAPFIFVPQPARAVPQAADQPSKPTSDPVALVFPLGRPAIPLPVEAFLPYRDPVATNSAQSPVERATTQLTEVIALVGPLVPQPKALDMLMHRPTRS